MADRIRTAPDWEDIRLFIALARHGSLSAAARALGVNHATVSRRIASLQRAVGERLVVRRPDGYVLTPAGVRVLAAATEMESAAATMGRLGAEGAAKGLVRVSATPGLAQGFLVARVAKLAARHPGLDIEVAGNVRTVSLERREADIALRLGRPRDGDVIAQRLATLGFGFYASTEWRRRIARGAQPEFVGFDEANAHLPEAAWLVRHFPRARIAFRTDNQVAQAAAAKAGAGVALLPHFIGRAETGLDVCTPGAAPPPRELWLVKRREDRNDALIRIVADFLGEAFASNGKLFEERPA